MNSATSLLNPSLCVADAVSRSAADIAYVLDRDYNIVDGNDRLWAEFGNGGYVSRGQGILSAIPEDERGAAERSWEMIIRHHKAERSVRRMRTCCGQVRLYSVMESPVETSGEIHGVLGIARDITEEAAIEDKLWNQQEHRDAAVEYSVRASLGLVRAYIFSMQMLESMPQAKRVDFSKVIAEEIDTLERGINSLLFSRSFSDVQGDSEVFDIREVISEVLLSFKTESERREIDLQFNAPADEVIYYGHYEAVSRVIANLVEFCIQRRTRSGSVEIHLLDRVEYIDVIIQDCGAPVSLELIEGLSKPLHTQRLTEADMVGRRFDIEVARLICDSLGGGFRVEVVQNNSITFDVMLPRTVTYYVHETRKRTDVVE